MNIRISIITFSYIFYFTLGVANCTTEAVPDEACAVTIETPQYKNVRFRLRRGEHFLASQPDFFKELRYALPRFFNKAPSIDSSTTTRERFLTILPEMKAKNKLLHLSLQHLISWLRENDPKEKAYIGYSSISPQERGFLSRTLEAMHFLEEKNLSATKARSLPATEETFNTDEIFDALMSQQEAKYSSLDIELMRQDFPEQFDKRFSKPVELSQEDMSLLHQIQFMREALELEYAIANEGNVEEVLSNIYVHLKKRDHIRTQNWMMPWLKGLELKSSLRNKLFDYIYYINPLDMVASYFICYVVIPVFIFLPTFLIYTTYFTEGQCRNRFYNPKYDPSSPKFSSASLTPTAPAFKLEKAIYPSRRMAHVMEADADTVVQDTSEGVKAVAGMILGNISSFRTTLTGGLSQFAYSLNQENATLLQFEQTTDRCMPLDRVDDATSNMTFSESATYACAFTTLNQGMLTLIGCGELSGLPIVNPDCVHNAIDWGSTLATILVIKGKQQPLMVTARPAFLLPQTQTHELSDSLRRSLSPSLPKSDSASDEKTQSLSPSEFKSDSGSFSQDGSLSRTPSASFSDLQWTAQIPAGILSSRSYKWTEIQANGTAGAPQARSGHAMGRTGDTLFMGFGLNQNQGTLADVYIYNISSDTWDVLNYSTSSRSRPGVAIYRNSTLVMDEDSNTNIDEFSADSYQSKALTGITSAITEPAMTVFNKNIYLFGGRQNGQFSNNLYISYNLSSAFLNITGISKPSARTGMQLALIGEKAYVFGGSNSSAFLNDIWELSLPSAQWVRLNLTSDSADGIPSPRSLYTSGTIGNHMVVFGGYPTRSNDLWEFDVISMTWKLIMHSGQSGSPLGRSSAGNFVQFGSDLYLFGGSNGSFYYNDLWRLRKSTMQLRSVNVTPNSILLYRPFNLTWEVSTTSGSYNATAIWEGHNYTQTFNAPQGWMQLNITNLTALNLILTLTFSDLFDAGAIVSQSISFYRGE